MIREVWWVGDDGDADGNDGGDKGVGFTRREA